MRHHVIYVPGILDDKYLFQRLAVKFWRLYGVRGHCHEMPWAGQDAYEPKFQRLLAEIDKYAEAGHKTSLIGASAGASAVLNAYAERKDKISGLACIVAKINGPETISDRLYAANPAFKTSLLELQKILPKLTAADKAKIHSFYSPVDQTVPYEATVIPGVKESKLPRLRHGVAIIYSVTLGAHYILKSLKQA